MRRISLFSFSTVAFTLASLAGAQDYWQGISNWYEALSSSPDHFPVPDDQRVTSPSEIDTLPEETFPQADGHAGGPDLANVKRAFDRANIPKDAGITFKPDTLLEVMLPQAVGGPILVTAGVRLQRDQTAIPPYFAIEFPAPTLSQLRETFVVSMVDLDAPTPQNPNVSEVRQFLGANFQIQSPDRFGVSLLVNSTPALSEFVQPTPPAGSDPHRYVFLLFAQPSTFNENVGKFVNASTPMTNFTISDFAREVGLGNPLGGSFIRVGPDASE